VVESSGISGTTLHPCPDENYPSNESQTSGPSRNRMLLLDGGFEISDVQHLVFGLIAKATEEDVCSNDCQHDPYQSERTHDQLRS
jgi:hypothetical protein